MGNILAALLTCVVALPALAAKPLSIKGSDTMVMMNARPGDRAVARDRAQRRLSDQPLPLPLHARPIGEGPTGAEGQEIVTKSGYFPVK